MAGIAEMEGDLQISWLALQHRMSVRVDVVDNDADS